MTVELQPYIGPRFFEREHQSLFFGRDQEIADLSSLIVAHGEVLVYAQSGVGKTSLLNAGVIPLLAKKGFDILPRTKVGGSIPQSIKQEDIANLYIFNTLISWESEIEPNQLVQTRLAEYLQNRRHPIDKYGQLLPRILIFDQFEELFFSYPERWQNREGFFEQVRDALEEDHLLRAVFIIREDYLAQLDPYAYLLPEKLRTRFRLERMCSEAALAAVTGPLAGTGRSYAKGVAEQLVDELLQVRVETATGTSEIITGEFVEPVQLQVVCQDLWQELPANTTVITPAHLHVFGDVNQALSRLYERSIIRAAQEARISVGDLREWFEHSLITPAGTRGSVYQGRDRSGGIPNAAIRVLENLHLVRGEWRAGARWYELNHDRFIEPIQQSNKKWLTEKWEAEQARKRLEAKVAEWIGMGRGKGGLLDEYELHDGERWLQIVSAAELDYSEDVTALIETSRLAIQEAERDKEAARRRELEQAQALAKEQTVRAAEAERSKRRTRYFAGALIVLLVLGGILYCQKKKFQKQLVVRNLTAAAYSSRGDPESSVLYALLALTEARTMQNDELMRPAEDALHRALQAQHLVYSLKAHKGPARAAAYSPDGLRLVTAGMDGNIKVWDAYSGKELPATFNIPAVACLSVEYQPTEGGALIMKVTPGGPTDQAGIKPGDKIMKIDGKPVAAQDSLAQQLKGLASGNRVKVELIRQGQAIKMETILGERLPNIHAVAFSPNGKLLATTGEDGKVTLWGADSYRELKTFLVNEKGVFKMAFNREGTRIATIDGEGNARIFDTNSGRELFGLKGHQKAVNDVAFSPDGKTIATVSFDQTAKLWEAQSGNELKSLTGHESPIMSLAFSPDGKLIATGDAWWVRIWDAEGGKLKKLLPSGHTNWVNGMAFSPDGRYFATASQDGKAKVWDVGTDTELYTLSGHGGGLQALAFSPEGQYLATASQEGEIDVWEIPTREVATLAAHGGPLRGVAYSPDGKRIATAGDDNSTILWDADSDMALILRFVGHGGSVRGVAFSNDGKRVVTASQDKTAKVWDTVTGKELLSLKGHEDGVNGTAFSPDGKRIATVSSDLTTKIWDAQSGQELLTLKGHGSPIKNVVFSPDGKRIATASLDKTVRIWDVASGGELLVLPHSDEVWGVTIRPPDGKQIATASRNGKIKVWDAISGRELRTLTGHTDWVWGIAYSPDGKQIASVSTDKTVKLWDAESGNRVRNLVGHSSELTAVAFSPDGKHLVTTGVDGRMQYCELGTEELLTLGLIKVTRSMKQEECEKYFFENRCPTMVEAIEKIVDGKKLAKEGDLAGALGTIQEAVSMAPSLPSSGLEQEIKRFTVPPLLHKGVGRIVPKRQAERGNCRLSRSGRARSAAGSPR